MTNTYFVIMYKTSKYVNVYRCLKINEIFHSGTKQVNKHEIIEQLRNNI